MEFYGSRNYTCTTSAMELSENQRKVSVRTAKKNLWNEFVLESLMKVSNLLICGIFI